MHPAQIGTIADQPELPMKNLLVAQAAQSQDNFGSRLKLAMSAKEVALADSGDEPVHQTEAAASRDDERSICGNGANRADDPANPSGRASIGPVLNGPSRKDSAAKLQLDPHAIKIAIPDVKIASAKVKTNSTISAAKDDLCPDTKLSPKSSGSMANPSPSFFDVAQQADALADVRTGDSVPGLSRTCPQHAGSPGSATTLKASVQATSPAYAVSSPGKPTTTPAPARIDLKGSEKIRAEASTVSPPAPSATREAQPNIDGQDSAAITRTGAAIPPSALRRRSLGWQLQGPVPIERRWPSQLHRLVQAGWKSAFSMAPMDGCEFAPTWMPPEP
jgi:hypothetical protein